MNIERDKLDLVKTLGLNESKNVNLPGIKISPGVPEWLERIVHFSTDFREQAIGLIESAVGTVASRMPREILSARLASMQFVASDFDGTLIAPGSKEFDEKFLNNLYVLEKAGVEFVGVTGKPKIELLELHQSLVSYEGQKPSQIKVLAEKGAFLVTLKANGDLTVENFLVSTELVNAMALVKDKFKNEWKPDLEKRYERYDVQIDLAGDGSHIALLPIDVFQKTALTNALRSPDFKGKSAFKLQRQDVCVEIFQDIETKIKELQLKVLQQPSIKYVGKASFEATGAIDKDLALNSYCAILNMDPNASMIYLGDSLNDEGAYRRCRELPCQRLACQVMHSDSIGEDHYGLYEIVDLVVVGWGSGGSILEGIVSAKGLLPSSNPI